MVIPEITKQNIVDALTYIDQNGILPEHRSTAYDLITDNGHKYPPKYVIAVADHLANGTEITTQPYTAVEAKNLLQSLGFKIETKERPVHPPLPYRNPYSTKLIESKNIIFRGAPGTGKSYLAREIAADIISDGACGSYTELSDAQKEQVEFVQFHPGYDYSDFVEGLRPTLNRDGSVGFALEDGIFKRFAAKARTNFEDTQKSQETIEREVSAQETMSNFLSSVELGADVFQTVSGNKFLITDMDDTHIHIFIPSNPEIKTLCLNINEIQTMLESRQIFEKVKDVTNFFGKTFATQGYSYDFALYKEIRAQQTKTSTAVVRREELKKYVFIIDEINRGEISKIFGELFFAIDPDYRGHAGEVLTQYANLHQKPEEKFYVPENLYIIGTMNDIDRSVDTFDFAMRRRFRFIPIRANERLEMLDELGDTALKGEAIRRMTALNQAIAETEDLNENYQIGAAYFLKLNHLSFDQLWTDYLHPLLQEYVQGMYGEEAAMKRFAMAYSGHSSEEGSSHDVGQNQR